MKREHELDLQEIPESCLRPDAGTVVAIEHLRAALTARAEAESRGSLMTDWLAPARQRRRSAQRRMVLAWSCAAALCIAVLPLSTHRSGQQVKPQVVANASKTAPKAVDDTALLEQVDTAISEPVPSSLAPLTELDSWNSTASTASSLDRTEKRNVTQ